MKKKCNSYRNWNFSVIKNNCISIHIAPHLGGRIMQIEMNGYEFFFNNPSLISVENDNNQIDNERSWLNFGGEKIWPAPQGWNSPDKWPGPPDDVIDGGIYNYDTVDSVRGEEGVLLTSPYDSRTRLQIVREILLSKEDCELKIKVNFFNKSNEPIRWSVWPVCQLATRFKNIDNECLIVCPTNTKSQYQEGYKIMHGLVNNPQYELSPEGNLIVNFKYIVGKVGLDTDSGWVAFINKDTGKVLFYIFEYQYDKVYPEYTSVQIWTQGRGSIYSRNKIIDYKDDKSNNPPYMEVELLSPLQDILPGDKLQFEYKILCSTIPFKSSVWTVNKMGVIAEPLSVTLSTNSIIITGKYGVFRHCFIKLILHRVNGNRDESLVLLENDVSPFRGVDICLDIDNNTYKIDGKSSLSVELFDKNNHFIGVIERINNITDYDR